MFYYPTLVKFQGHLHRYYLTKQEQKYIQGWSQQVRDLRQNGRYFSQVFIPMILSMLSSSNLGAMATQVGRGSYFGDIYSLRKAISAILTGATEQAPEREKLAQRQETIIAPGYDFNRYDQTCDHCQPRPS